MNFIERLEKQCLEHGNRECLFDGTDSLSYADMWRISGQVYAYIKNNGIGKEQTVMISMDRNVYSLVCMIGILRSNAVFLVMGQDYPEKRKEYIKRDTECALEITEEIFKDILKTGTLSGYENRKPHDLAYMVHTSGTTGNPKCVMQEFGGIERCRAVGRAEGENVWSEADRMAVTSPINFVACIYQLFYALSCGAAIVLVPKNATNNLKICKKFLEDNNITAAFMTPSLLKTMGKLPDTVKSAFIFGEAAKNIYYDNIDIYNFYSQSELGSLGTFFKIDKEYDVTPIGLPCDSSMEFKVVDENDNPVIDGQEGELCIDIPYFRGYKNLPENTARALSGGIYHTGDIVKMNEGGQLVLLHRKDSMVKINGNRVELTEVENRMSEIIGNRWAAVKVCKNGSNSYLSAYYVDELPITQEELKKRMAESLANYMLPSFYVKLNEIPLNANGKFSRILLPEPDFSTLRKEYKSPKSDMEKKITAVFEKVLGAEKIGADEDFFELGGDSLSAIEAITELDIPNLLTADLFYCRTAEALSKKCIELISRFSEEKVNHVQPLIGTQNFVRIYHEMLEENTAYNLASFYKLKENTDITRLKTGIAMVMNSHESFRTIIRRSEYGAELVLVNEIREPEVIDTTEKELNSIMDGLVVPYELYGELLYKCKIFRTEKAAYLFFEMHHIITDGTSMQIILKEIEDAYYGIDIKPDQYFRIIQGRVKAQSSLQYENNREYYRRKMPSSERLFAPPFDFAEAGQEAGISGIKLELSEENLIKIRNRYGLSPTDFFIMCYLIALSKVTGKEKVGTAYTVNGRDSALCRNAVGLLLYSFFVNLDINKDDTIDDIVRKMHREFDEIKEHRGFDAASFMTKENAKELICSNILYQDQLRDATENIKDLIEEKIELSEPYYKASYYWEFEIINNRDSMDIVIYYNASGYSEKTAARMLRAYRETCLEVFNRACRSAGGDGSPS